MSQKGKRVENHSFPPLPLLHLLLPFNNVIEQKQEEHDKSIYFHLGHILRQRSRQLIILNQLAIHRIVGPTKFRVLQMLLWGSFWFLQVPLEGSFRFFQVSSSSIMFGIRSSIISWTDSTQKVWLSLERGSSSPFQRRFFTPNTTHFLCVFSTDWCTKICTENVSKKIFKIWFLIMFMFVCLCFVKS